MISVLGQWSMEISSNIRDDGSKRRRAGLSLLLAVQDL
jgi:hypothetical protein